ncbi:energy transducer TonB [Dysgonomonas sp. 511]|nr:energy transducer TonB [Dysgonomonas sp. 511]
MQSVSYGIDKEAKRIVRTMPKWNPGIKDGEPVDVWFTLPIVFRLK